MIISSLGTDQQGNDTISVQNELSLLCVDILTQFNFSAKSTIFFFVNNEEACDDHLLPF